MRPAVVFNDSINSDYVFKTLKEAKSVFKVKGVSCVALYWPWLRAGHRDGKELVAQD